MEKKSLKRHLLEIFFRKEFLDMSEEEKKADIKKELTCSTIWAASYVVLLLLLIFSAMLALN